MKAPICKNIFKILAAILMIAILSSCAAKQINRNPAPLRSTSEYVDPDQDYVVKRVYDPWEGFNRERLQIQRQVRQVRLFASGERHIGSSSLRSYATESPIFSTTWVNWIT